MKTEKPRLCYGCYAKVRTEDVGIGFKNDRFLRLCPLCYEFVRSAIRLMEARDDY